MSDTHNTSTEFELPPASFSFLVESIMMQTQMQLGIFSFDESNDDAEPNLQIARHSIDLLTVLQEKTRGNLTTEEHRMLENGLTELRFRYVQVSEELQQKSVEQSALAAAAASETPVLVSADGGKGTKTSSDA